MTGITRRYECDLRYSDTDDSIIMPVIQSVYPGVNINAVEEHSVDPLITPGRVRVTLNNVTGEFHRELLTIPGVDSFD